MSKLTKVTRVFFIALVYLVSSTLIRFLLTDEHEKKLILSKNLRRHAKWMLAALGITVRETGHEESEGHHLIVANHVSYLDVLVIASNRPCLFVTSVEVSNQGLVGFFAKSAGSLFVERRSRGSVKEQIDHLSRALKDGFNVVVFPEGTSSDGLSVLPFKQSLLNAAIESQIDVLPVCLNYQLVNDERVTAASRDAIFYYGDMEFFAHLGRLLSLKSITVEMRWLEIIKVTADSSRKSVADSAYRTICQSYVPII